jgi:hypothetical protein
MAELHHLVLLAQRLAEGRRQHPSHTAFSQWLKDNDLDHLTHRDRAALLKIAQLDPQEASTAISKSRYITPERLWYRVVRPRLTVPKTAPLPEHKTPEGKVDPVEEFLERLEARQPGSAEIIQDDVLPFSLEVVATSRRPMFVLHCWLANHYWLDLDGDDLAMLVSLISTLTYPEWVEAVTRVRKTPRRSDQ